MNVIERYALTALACVIAAGLSLIFLAVVFRPLELAFPAKKGQKFFRPAWVTDLCFFVGQYVLWSALVYGVLAEFGGWFAGWLPVGFRVGVASQSWWVQAVEMIVLSDLLIYWGHRLQHNVGFLWRFHAVHHTAEHLDWLAAHREHPLDTIYTVGLINLPAFMLGFPLQTIAGFVAFRGIWAIYIHSNVRLPIGPLRWFIGAPELHHWHHDRNRRAGNYANISPLMDILFGTYRCPDHEPESFGIKQPAPRTYHGHLLAPLLPRRARARLRLRQMRRAAGAARDLSRSTPAIPLGQSCTVAKRACPPVNEDFPDPSTADQPPRAAPSGESELIHRGEGKLKGVENRARRPLMG